jgi:predicted nucleic acid-binding protein
MITAVDTSILLDVLVDADDADQSEALLIQAYEQGSLIISPAVYAELVPQTQSQDELDRWLSLGGIDVVPFTKEHVYTAGLAHAACRKAGGKRTRILADFFIGAHALHEANALLTRDRGFYRKYFSGLAIVSSRGKR